MFENPAALGLFALLALWFFWASSRKPLPWIVGGLEPFRELASSSSSKPSRPLSFWLAFFGLSCGIFAIAQPIRLGGSPILLWDASISHTGGLSPGQPGARPLSDAGSSRDWEFQFVGMARKTSAEPLLLESILACSGSKIAVMTDCLPPNGLPDWVSWYSTGGIHQNVAILNVLPNEKTGWDIHWRAWGSFESMALFQNEELISTLSGEHGIFWIENANPGQVLRIANPDGSQIPNQPTWDDHWDVEVPVFELPSLAHETWLPALLTFYPQAEIRHGFSEPPVPGKRKVVIKFIQASATKVEADVIAVAEDPFQVMEPLAALAWLENKLKERSFFLPPARPIAECQPTSPPADWSSIPWGQPIATTWTFPLAALGFVALLLSLACRKIRA
ncbi:MAG: hypothetical protein QGH51_09525 [Planctomycetota bacterium]|nr:hypothetical protein [Planctomycetota bacterium]MDP6942250.1 hypothetical protein [Planctomycetota bacterium]